MLNSIAFTRELQYPNIKLPMPAEETHEQSTPLAMESDNHAEPQPIHRHLVTRIVSAHGLLSWLTLIFAIILYILTIIYAWRSDLVSRNELFGGSPAKALQILNILSWFGNSLLGLAIAQAWDLTRAMLTAREPNGLCLLDSLALQPGTGIDGLLEIIWRARKVRKFKPGTWSVFRLLSMTIVPILGIVVLSKSVFNPNQLFFSGTVCLFFTFIACLGSRISR